MAAVADKARTDGLNPAGTQDKTLVKANRTNAGTPVGALTPQFAGEWVYDTTGNIWWRGVNTLGSTIASWVQESRNFEA